MDPRSPKKSALEGLTRLLCGPTWDYLGPFLGLSCAIWSNLEPFWDHFGTVFGLSWTILKPSWEHLRIKKKCPKHFGSERLFSWPFEGRPLRNARFQFGKKRPSKFLNPLRGTFVTQFGTPFWEQICTRSSQDEHRGPSGASKTKKQPFQNP